MNLLEAMEGIAYVVRQDGRILTYGRRNWNRFATENQGTALLDPSHIEGRDLFGFISGGDVRQRYRDWMDAVLADARNRPAVFQYRCDSPTEKRELRMSIGKIDTEADPLLLFQSTTLDIATRPPLNIYDFQAVRQAMHAHAVLTVVAICSFCQRLRWPPGAEAALSTDWIDAETYYARGGRSAVAISHGVCEDCYRADTIAA